DIKKNKDRVATFDTTIINRNIHKHQIVELHEPMTVATKVKPSVFEYASYKVQVETKGELTAGMTVAERRERLQDGKTPGKKVMICKNVDSRGFKQLFLDRLTGPMSS